MRYIKDAATGAIRDTVEDETFGQTDAIEALNRQERIIDRLHARIAKLNDELATANDEMRDGQ